MKMIMAVIISFALCFVDAMARTPTLDKSVSISISSVAKCSVLNTKSRDRGMVELTFHNGSTKPIFLILTALVGLGSARHRRAVKPYLGKTNGGDFATVSYVWKRQSGQYVLSGVYDISTDEIKMEAGARKSIFIPVSLPKKHGRYTLLVHFDNRKIEDIAATNAELYVDSSVFFEADAQVPITIR
jgi:hypothetical protein